MLALQPVACCLQEELGMSQPHEMTRELQGSYKARVACARGKLGTALTNSLRRPDTEALRWHDQQAYNG